MGDSILTLGQLAAWSDKDSKTTTVMRVEWKVERGRKPNINGQYSSWDSSKDYAKGDDVKGEDLRYYKSNCDINIGNNPIIDTVNWTHIHPTKITNLKSWLRL